MNCQPAEVGKGSIITTAASDSGFKYLDGELYPADTSRNSASSHEIH